MSAGLDRGPDLAHPDTADTVARLATDILLWIVILGGTLVTLLLLAGGAQ